VTATPLPDGQGTRITFNNGGHQDGKMSTGRWPGSRR
jgi:hypothetical protein